VRLSISLILTLGLLACSSTKGDSSPKSDPAQTAPATAPPLTPIVGPSELQDENPDPKIVEVSLRAEAASIELSSGHTTKVLAYNGQIPGPLLHARVGDRVIVHFTNGLAEATTVHWHGLRISSDMDGTPRVQEPIAPGGTFTYEFVVPDAGTYWYHPHLNTIEQIDRGLYGPIVIEEKEPPRFTAERLFVLDDIRLDASYQIAPYGDDMDMMMGRFGNKLLLNGRSDLASGTAQRGGIERWRLINAAGARVMDVAIEGASFRVVGADGGLLPQAYATKRLSLAVGQRYDVEVTYDQDAATQVKLVAYVLADNGNGGTVEKSMPLAALDFDGTTSIDAPSYPEVTLPELVSDATQKQLRLGMMQDAAGHMMMTINGKDGMTLPMAEFNEGQAVRFSIVNDDMMHFHPFHLHGNFFQIVSRNGKASKEPGLKDMALINPSETVVIETHFENPGQWMYHCHIAEHAEHGMMAELMVHASP